MTAEPGTGAPQESDRLLASDGQSTAGNARTGSSNLVKRTFEEVCGLVSKRHELREQLVARGLDVHIINALVEAGSDKRTDEFERLLGAAVDASARDLGGAGIDDEELRQRLDALIEVKLGQDHAAHLASQQGVNMRVLNQITQLVMSNPGDGGVQTINTFVAYAEAAGVPLDRIDAIRRGFKEESDSVLPDIARDMPPARSERLRSLVIHATLGCLLTFVVMRLVH